jgi:hypothetical protein
MRSLKRAKDEPKNTPRRYDTRFSMDSLAWTDKFLVKLFWFLSQKNRNRKNLIFLSKIPL